MMNSSEVSVIHIEFKCDQQFLRLYISHHHISYVARKSYDT